MGLPLCCLHYEGQHHTYTNCLQCGHTSEDIDAEFRRKFTKRFCGWEETVKAASEILIDEMRTLLECWA